MPVTSQAADPSDDPVFRLEDYLKATRTGRWIYQRCKTPWSEDCSSKAYTREITTDRITEGELLSFSFEPLYRYLRKVPDSETEDDSREVLSTPPMKAAGFIYFELEEPLEVIPRDLTWGEVSEAESPIAYYDYWGKLSARGTLLRRVALDGRETITVPAGTFEECLRVRLDLEIRFPWVLSATWASTLWLHPEMGEVRRVHRLSGWFLILWFAAGHEYVLQEAESGHVIAGRDELAPRWKTGGVYFDRIAPRPVIGGMIVDYADASATPVTQPALSPQYTTRPADPENVNAP